MGCHCLLQALTENLLYAAAAAAAKSLQSCPQMASHQASPSLGFSRQEHWSALSFPSPILYAAAAAKLLQSCPTPCDPIDSSPLSSPIPGILQARTLEWVAISFSNASIYMAQMAKNLPTMQETQVQSPGQEEPLEKGMGYPLQYSCLENIHICLCVYI